jgi:hypothetical protein
MKVKVIRGEALNEYPGVIVEPLCTIESVGREYGKAFLYDEGFDKMQYTIQTNADKIELRGSSVLQVIDASLGEVFRGRVRGISIQGQFTETEGLDLIQSIELERSLDE